MLGWMGGVFFICPPPTPASGLCGIPRPFELPELPECGVADELENDRWCLAMLTGCAASTGECSRGWSYDTLRLLFAANPIG